MAFVVNLGLIMVLSLQQRPEQTVPLLVQQASFDQQLQLPEPVHIFPESDHWPAKPHDTSGVSAQQKSDVTPVNGKAQTSSVSSSEEKDDALVSLQSTRYKLSRPSCLFLRKL